VEPAAVSFDVIGQACQLLQSYVLVCGAPALRQLLSAGLALVASPAQDLSRAGLIACLKMLAAASQTATATGLVFQGTSPQEAGKATASPHRCACC